jgi:hypothetical protein
MSRIGDNFIDFSVVSVVSVVSSTGASTTATFDTRSVAATRRRTLPP